MKQSSHPSVRRYQATKVSGIKKKSVVESAIIKETAMDCGADDAGIIELERKAAADYRSGLTGVMHDVRSLMIVAVRINRTAVRSQAHSVADQEFKRGWERFKSVQGRIVTRLSGLGVKAVGMPVGFPMEMQRWPGRVWITNEKLFAVEAGLGKMGINRLLIHPEFGASVLLGTILIAAECDAYDRPVDFNPCIECGLCLRVCPTGAVKARGFDFTSCYSHNYRERLGGFVNWVEQMVDSRTVKEYRQRVDDAETLSMWQNLSVGPQTRCDRCMGVCPAGQAAIGEYLEDRKAYVTHYLAPFQSLPETIYVVKGSDAEAHVKANFPSKSVKTVSNGLRPLSAAMFLDSLPRMFQAGQSSGIDAVYHFSFDGDECLQGTVTIRDRTIRVEPGLTGRADLHLTADAATWIRFLNRETHMLAALITRRIKIKGSPRLMKDFSRCFPG